MHFGIRDQRILFMALECCIQCSIKRQMSHKIDPAQYRISSSNFTGKHINVSVTWIFHILELTQVQKPDAGNGLQLWNKLHSDRWLKVVKLLSEVSLISWWWTTISQHSPVKALGKTWDKCFGCLHTNLFQRHASIIYQEHACHATFTCSTCEVFCPLWRKFSLSGV